ncbi:MAG: FliH/SctL family protein [Planctomycetota bacterium]
MGLIRRSDFESSARNALVMDLGDVERQGEHLRRLAREHAERVVAEAKAERERLLAGAHDEGFAKGLAEGDARGHAEGLERGRDEAFADWRERIDRLASSWEAMLEEFERRRADLLLAARQDALRLALSLAERVVRARIEHDPELAARQVEAALGALAEATRATVRVSQRDVEAVERMLPEILKRLDLGPSTELIASDEVALGGCVVTTPEGGRIDASIEAQLDRLVASLAPEQADEGQDQHGPGADRANTDGAGA